MCSPPCGGPSSTRRSHERPARCGQARGPHFPRRGGEGAAHPGHAPGGPYRHSRPHRDGRACGVCRACHAHRRVSQRDRQGLPRRHPAGDGNVHRRCYRHGGATAGCVVDIRAAPARPAAIVCWRRGADAADVFRGQGGRQASLCTGPCWARGGAPTAGGTHPCVGVGLLPGGCAACAHAAHTLRRRDLRARPGTRHWRGSWGGRSNDLAAPRKGGSLHTGSDADIGAA